MLSDVVDNGCTVLGRVGTGRPAVVRVQVPEISRKLGSQFRRSPKPITETVMLGGFLRGRRNPATILHHPISVGLSFDLLRKTVDRLAFDKLDRARTQDQEVG